MGSAQAVHRLKNMKRMLAAAFAAMILAAPLNAPAVASEQTIKISAKNWAFVPGTITLKLNQKVKLEFVATEGIHAITIPDLGVNDVVNVGSTPSDIEVTPKKLGTFVAHCAIFCGAGHNNMILTIKVVK